MKNIRNLILLLSCWLLASSAFAQAPPILTVVLTNASTGQPVSNQWVYVHADSTFGVMFYDSGQTNPNGVFQSNLLAASLSRPTLFFVRTAGCNGAMLLDTITLSPGQSHTMTISVCSGTPVGGCQASFSAWPDSASAIGFGVSFSASSAGQAPFSYSWDFGDGGSASVANPYHVYSQAGWKLVCVTITDATGCSSTRCDSVNAGGPNSGCQLYAYVSASGNAVNPLAFFFSNLSSGNYSSIVIDFGDGNSGTMAFGANGIAHTYAQNGNYTVTVTALDAATGCSDTYSFNLTVGQPTNGHISGFVLNGNLINTDNYIIYLITSYQDSVSGDTYLVAIDSILTVAPDSGSFYFNNLAFGTYYVKAALAPGSPNYAGYIPTYYNNSFQWAFATAISLSPANAQPWVQINLIAGANPGGPGFVGGNVAQGANKMAAAGDPVANIPVVISGQTNGVKAYTMTDASGNFSLSNLPYGTYTIQADVLGRYTNDLTVTLSASSPSANGLSIEVNQSPASVAPNSAAVQADALFPNPASSTASLRLNLLSATNVDISVLNVAGQVVSSQSQDLPAGTSTLSLDVQSLPAGLYFVKVGQAGSSFQTLKLVKN